MSTASATMTAALQQLAIANDAPRKEGPALGSWRWTVRQRMASVRDALLEENGDATGADGWLAARGGAAFRERNALLGRLGELGAQVLEESDVAAVRAQVARLVVDVSHHVQRVNDLAYDEVEIELGGSE
ncbi:hypothetical protein BH11ACT8_BH11ACT8_09860 [soil metagenome]